MKRSDIRETFENYFELFKKTEGDRTSWSAVWFTIAPTGEKFEINMTKCPKGTTFKVFLNDKRIGEIEGWDRFFEDIENLTGDHPGVYDEDDFFGSMMDML